MLYIRIGIAKNLNILKDPVHMTVFTENAIYVIVSIILHFNPDVLDNRSVAIRGNVVQTGCGASIEDDGAISLERTALPL